MLTINIDEENKNISILREKNRLNYFKYYIYNNYESFLINMFHIYILITFEILFYFYYIVKIERKEIIDVLNSFTNQFKQYILLPPQQKNILIQKSNDICNVINKDYYNRINHELFINSLNIIIIGTTIILILFGIYLYLFRNIKRTFKLIFSSLFFIAIVGIFEYLFFKNIVLNYHIIDNNEAICYLTKGLI